MKQKGIAQFIGTFIMIGCVLIFLFYRTVDNNRKSEEAKKGKLTEYDKLAEYDYVGDYPKTVKEVMKLHCRYLKYLLGNDPDKLPEDEQVEALCISMRNLYDLRLLDKNSETDNISNLKNEIAAYKEEGLKIIGFDMPESSQVRYATQNNIETAEVDLTVNMKVKGITATKEETYLLAKDALGRWKILTWELKASNINTTEQ